jgi:hypothetical protein
LPGLKESLYAAYAGGERTARIDVTLGLHEPATGTPGGTAVFVPYRTGKATTDWSIVALGAVQQPPVGEVPQQYALYRCSVELSCVEPLHTFPPSDSAQIWTAPNAVLVVELIRYVSAEETEVEMWRSADNGATFTRWASVDKLLAPALAVVRTAPRVSIATHPAFPRVMYLRVGYSYDPRTPSSVPVEQLWRSDDAGTSWRSVGFRRVREQRGAQGTLPFRGSVPGPDLQGIFLTGDGRLFALGLDPVGLLRSLPYGVFCSVDGGRRWGRTCAR